MYLLWMWMLRRRWNDLRSSDAAEVWLGSVEAGVALAIESNAGSSNALRIRTAASGATLQIGCSACVARSSVGTSAARSARVPKGICTGGRLARVRTYSVGTDLIGCTRICRYALVHFCARSGGVAFVSGQTLAAASVVCQFGIRAARLHDFRNGFDARASRLGSFKGRVVFT